MVDKSKLEQIIDRFKDHPIIKDLEKQIESEILEERKKRLIEFGFIQFCFLEKEREKTLPPLREAIVFAEERVKQARNELDEAQRQLSAAESR